MYRILETTLPPSQDYLQSNQQQDSKRSIRVNSSFSSGEMVRGPQLGLTFPTGCPEKEEDEGLAPGTDVVIKIFSPKKFAKYTGVFSSNYC
jgi:hypothetical protein